jgi:tRNA (guanine37-N1)-methyltransferase
MKIDVLTLFPKMFEALNAGIFEKAVGKELIKLNLIDFREYSADKHKRVDDYSFGGGSGMLLAPQPIYDAIKETDKDGGAFKIYMSPKGRLLNNDLCRELAAKENLLILCGHYEGVDERIIENRIDLEVSIGDYILSGGELACMVLIDCVSRFIPEVLGNSESAYDESFCGNLLEYPQYTRPESFEGMDVPKVLLSGNHKKIAEYRLAKQIEITKKNRPDLYKKYPITWTQEENDKLMELVLEDINKIER